MISFIWTCPNGHVLWPQFDRADLSAAIDRGDAKCFCIRCGVTSPLPRGDQENIRKRLDDGTL